MVPLNFTEYDVTWVVSKFTRIEWALGAEAIELSNCHIYFGCASEELRLSVAKLVDWMDNSSPPWAAYHILITCRLVALNKRLGVCLMEIQRDALPVPHQTCYEGVRGSGKDNVC